MGQIQERKRKGGKPSFTAQVRRKKGGKTVFNITETFDKKSQAADWIKKKEREFSQPGGLEAALTAKRSKALRKVITAYIEAQNGSIGRSKLQDLKATARFDFASRDADTLTADDFVRFAQNLFKGIQPAPIDPLNAPADYYNLKPRLPQTVASYMTHLGVVIRHAGPLVGLKLPKAEFQEAMEATHR